MRDDETINKTELLARIDRGWQALQAFVYSLTPDQRDAYIDHVGWTVKDHITHLMTWEDGIYGFLSKVPRWQQMNVDKGMWDEMMTSRDFDPVNAIIQQRYKDQSFDEIMEQAEKIHNRLIPLLNALTDEQFHAPIFNVQPDFRGERPLIGLVIDDTYGHIEEHMPWMQAITVRNDQQG